MSRHSSLMGPKEIRPLICAARRAFELQESLGNLEPGQTFDAWRRRQTMEAVGKPGFTSCSHDDFRPLLARFEMLSGRSVPAFELLVNSGVATDHSDPEDTHELRDQIIHLIKSELASVSTGQTIGESYVVAIAKSKFRQPHLHGLESCHRHLTSRQLRDLLVTLRARIASRLRKASATPFPS